jgi:ectoine hydroxylase-related dioxygenase (phytanoyl-CoA dioxygenase family)
MSELYIQKSKELNELDYCKVKIGHKNFLKKLRKKWIKLFNNISSQLYGIKIKNSKQFELIKTKVKLGEALIFSQFLVHRSGTNTSNKIRFSLQLRVTDLLNKIDNAYQ